jgi:aspartyl-tRNA(Asn)/glutamyl-tRNA(Gln) amidotransferase subunit C
MADVTGVSMDEVLRVAELANLDLTAEEVPLMQRDLNAILGHIAQLNELDTSGVPAMSQVGELLSQTLGAEIGSTGANLRADTLLLSLDRKAVMASAPESDGRFFKVPKVIER